MEDSSNPTFFAFDSPKGQSSYIKVIGVGGGGGNAVNHMYKMGIEGVDFIVCNTDMKALNASPVPNKIPLGSLGLGAGGKPEKARKAAEDRADDIRDAISHNTQMLFITAGMGGGTGTGAAPVIAKIARQIDLQNEENEKILVVAIVTRPFEFEGEEQRLRAETGIDELRENVDSIIVIDNDKLRSFGSLTRSKAFAMADDILLTAAKGIAEIITKDGLVNRDFQDVKTVMENSGTALMSAGCGTGENRARVAIEAATTSVLLADSDITGAKNVLLYFSYSHEFEMTIDEMIEVTDYIKKETGGKAKVLWGDGYDDSLGEELKVILIATGFEKVKKAEPRVTELISDDPRPAKPAPAAPDADGMEIIHRENPTAEVRPAAPEEEKPVEKKEKHIIPFEDSSEEEEEAVRKGVAAHDSTDEEKIELRHAADEEAMRKAEEDARRQADELTRQRIEAEARRLADLEVQRRLAANSAKVYNDVDMSTAASRIAHLHDLLRNNPNGAEIVQGMRTSSFSAEPIYSGEHSSAVESSSVSVDAKGNMVKNPFVHKGLD